MRFSPQFLDDIRDRVPIADVVGTRVTWDRRKTSTSRGDYWACCPFHGENTPSFHCENRKGRYHCFGCGVSGDHFKFLMELDGLSFPEAVERVADMAGVALPARDPEAEKRARERATLTDVMEMATRFFEASLQGQAGAQARAYLRGRGLSSATQQTFRLGFAPDSRNALKAHLADKGVPREQIEACGLVVAGPDIAVSYDRFRDRVMFPIEDPRGRVIAFGGRAMSPDIPAKYINSNETELFHKGRVLYNHARARQAVARGATLVAVEGYMDVIALAQAGFASAVAPLGTALTETQLDMMWRAAGEPVLCFDGDQAGLRAAWRAADLALPLLQPGRSVRFALLPEGRDPDDLVREEGAEAFSAVLAEARPLADLIWSRETAGGVYDTPERRAALEARLKAVVGTIRDESLRRHYGQDMRERLHAFFGPVRSPRGEGRRPGPGGQGQPARGGGPAGRLAVTDSLARSALVKAAGGVMPLRETAILVTLVNHPGLLDEHFDAFERLHLTHGDLRRLHAAVLDVTAHQPGAGREALVGALAAAGLEAVWQRAEGQVRRSNLWSALADAALEDARESFLQALHLHQSAGSLHKELKAAELALASDPTEENYRHLVEIQAQMRDVQATEALVEGFGVLSGRSARN
ncbi:DNA primase [Aquibium sp. A9E412]|uniref:DNA primase n=1 Tax=Aquibium sp. A9E412 TaxID=2976767 RepID=UPI0025B05DAF|nr:DNA primase [Aquibium sp. A9E412]MDN2565486.1 DNA primase [Aquibium sp. A9E412]